jgi:hypothetical protein
MVEVRFRYDPVAYRRDRVVRRRLLLRPRRSGQEHEGED